MKKHFFYFSIISFLFTNSLTAQTFPAKIGVGLDGIGGIALEFPNVTLTATAWQSVANNGNAKTDAAGWPTEDFRVVLFDHRPFNAWNNAPDDPAKYVPELSGTYSMSFKGQAVLTSWSDAPIIFQNQQYDVVSNMTTVNIFFPPGGGANSSIVGNYGFLMINFLQTQFTPGVKGVKQLKVMRPGYPHDSPQIFRTAYLNALSPFSTMRFMDYLQTNNSDRVYPNVQKWSDRLQADAPRFNRGAPWEYVIALGNYTAKDIWINIPADADSMYIVELARLMKSTLRPDINIYLEYSNEVWNSLFSQYQYNYQAVLKSTEDAGIRASTPWDDRRRARRAAKQIIKAGKIFEVEFGISLKSKSRIRPVFAWQIGGWLPWYEDVLQWINTTYGAPADFIYGIASAPYFGEKGGTSPQEIVAAMSSVSDANLPAIRTLAELAAQYKIKHLQYEGGPDNGGGNTANIANRISANRIPEMKTAVIHNYRDNWFSAAANGAAPVGTNDLVNYFVMSGKVSRYGCWGATEDLKDIKNGAKSPKYDALCVLSGKCGNEPKIELISPLNNSKVTLNNPQSILVTASDPDGKVNKVEFFEGSTLLGVDSIAPFSINWTPSKIGISGILAKAIDNDGKFTFTDMNIIEVSTKPLSSFDTDSKISFKIFPVPAIDYIEIELLGINQAIYEIRDIVGTLQVSGEIENGKIQVPAYAFDSGIYFITLMNNGKRSTQKFVISK
ncbi:MAG: Ig-like domain-containing protein [Saprospiraceae bacterium]